MMINKDGYNHNPEDDSVDSPLRKPKHTDMQTIQEEMALSMTSYNDNMSARSNTRKAIEQLKADIENEKNNLEKHKQKLEQLNTKIYEESKGAPIRFG